MRIKFVGLLALVMGAGPIAANAQETTLDYQGVALNGYTQTTSPPLGLVTYSGAYSGPISGSLVLSAPLGDNLNNVAVTPLSWDFNASLGFSSSFFQYEPDNTVASFLFSTSSTGAITGWNMNLSYETGGPDGGGTAFQSFSSGGMGQDLLYHREFDGNDLVEDRMSSPAPGTWTVTAPEIDPASAASGLTLLLGGLAVLGGRRRLLATVHR